MVTSSRSLEVAGPAIQGLPRDIESVGRKAKQYGFPFTPDQTIINEYVGDQGIDPHTDLEDQFDDTVCSISLNGWASMVFTRPGFKTIRLMLEPVSLLMMKGECRYVAFPKHGESGTARATSGPEPEECQSL